MIQNIQNYPNLIIVIIESLGSSLYKIDMLQHHNIEVTIRVTKTDGMRVMRQTENMLNLMPINTYDHVKISESILYTIKEVNDLKIQLDY